VRTARDHGSDVTAPGGTGPRRAEAWESWVWSGRDRLRVPFATDVLPPATPVPAHDPAGAVRRALAAPPGTERLSSLARGAARVAIAVPDGSRKAPTPDVLPPVLAELEAGGVSPASTTVVVGCGMHRDPSRDEIVGLVGGAAGRVETIAAQGRVTPHADLGTTATGCPVCIARRVAEADLVVAVGVVEPHLYAGYSGGVKAVAVGCAGEETIVWTHSPAFIARPGVELLRLAGNPFQACLREIARRTSLRFAVNVVLDQDGGLVEVAAGGPAAVQERLVKHNAETWLRRTDRTYDLVVAGVPAPKDASLYQATRAATYLGLADRPAVRDGGLIVVCAGLAEGAGGGPAEEHFADLLREHGPGDLLRRGLDTPLGPGGQRAWVVARVLSRFRLGMVGGRPPAGLGIEHFEDLEEAFRAAAPRDGRDPEVLAVADAMTTVVRGYE